ncbi:MAG: hypothetical protein V7642_3845 [Burkholderiales bacterium]
MRKSLQATLASSLAVVCFSVVNPVHAQHPQHDAKAAPTSVEILQTGAALRDLWVGHVFWVRNVVLETSTGNTAAATAAEQEVVANAKQISAAIEPFYGKAASEKLFGLLAGHYGAVKQYLEATLANSKPRQDSAMKTLTGNAGDIAVFLSGANPNLPLETLRSLLLAHGAHHVQQIQQLRDKQYVQEAKTWDAMKNHMYVIADAMAAALVKQFPAKFS